jgi:PAS domain S-box-containing protein
LGFFIILVIGILFAQYYQDLADERDEHTRQVYTEYIESMNKDTLSHMALFIEQRFPFLHDIDRLKREGAAGTDWFWARTAELVSIKNAFGFSYVYYLEKSGENFIQIIDADIRQDYQTELLHQPAWTVSAVPPFIKEAWETGKLTLSPGAYKDEWGEHISAVLPILNDGNVAGLLGIDYDVSSLKKPMREVEEFLIQRQDALRRRLEIALAVFVIIVIVVMVIQLTLDYRSVLLPVTSLEAAERTRVMMDATPMICSLMDTEGNILDCNEETVKILGLSGKSDFIDHLADFYPEYQADGEKSVDKFRGIIKTALETGSCRTEWMYHTASGEMLPVESITVRVPWKDGWRLLGYDRDLREIKAKETAAREAEERMQVMLDTMSFASFFMDDQGQVLDYNRRALELFACKEGQVFKDNFFKVFSPQYQLDGRPSREKGLEKISEVFREGQAVFQWQHRRGDGQPLPAEVTLVRVKWKNGFRLIAYVRDLRDLTETTDNLKRLQCMVEGWSGFFMYIGERAAIEYTNPAVSEITGHTKEALLRDGLSLIFNEETLYQVKQKLSDAIRKNRNITFEEALTDKEGRIRDYVFSAFPSAMYDGTLGIGIVGRDITELKQIQRELSVAKEQAERALALESSYSRIKSDFLSRVSHEMRTPLNAIIGTTAMAKKTANVKYRERYFETIEESSEQLLEIVNDMLDIVALNNGEFEFSPAPFSFGGAMNPIAGEFKSKAELKGQRFILDIDSRIPDALISDERRFKYILTNLLDNAVKFTPENGTISLSASLLENRGDECVVRFEVTDTGAGIAPDMLRRMWETFEQAESAVTRSYGGMGLSLALIKRIVTLMKGEIQVESELGKGARFMCRLIFGVDISTSEEDRAGAPPEGDEIPDLSGKRILVVDDVDINREILAAILEETGVMVDEAQNGAEALKKFSETKYDMVLMDLHMPLMDGFNATREMRDSALPWARTTPVIAISADNSPEIRAQCLEAGLNGHITKPVDTKRLFETISKWS